jgi:Domain of unknown function (DUF4190)
VSSSYQPTPVQDGRAVEPRYNTLSIVAFVLAFFVSLGAVICGHIALAQISRTGERGHGLAVWALVLGYLGLLLGIIATVAVIAVLASRAASGTY